MFNDLFKEMGHWSFAATGLSDWPLARKAEMCAGALKEARRLVSVRVYGPLLSRLLNRAGELLDDIDEVLIGLDPDRDHDVFSRVAALHREMEEIQAMVPRQHRLPQSRGR